jgi:hypothetical protein
MNCCETRLGVLAAAVPAEQVVEVVEHLRHAGPRRPGRALQRRFHPGEPLLDHLARSPSRSAGTTGRASSLAHWYSDSSCTGLRRGSGRLSSIASANRRVVVVAAGPARRVGRECLVEQLAGPG